MENTEVSHSPDIYNLAVWAHTNRQRIISITVGVLVIAAIVSGYYWYQAGHETAAGDALSNVPRPLTAQGAPAPATAEPYLKIADEYSGTMAAARALLIAGGIEFDQGKYTDAQGTFEKFMNQYAGSPYSSVAQLGIATSLEAQGKIKEATSRYEDLVKRHQADATTPQARVALAHLYVVQNKPEMALQQYSDLLKANNNDSYGAEAEAQLQELITKYPQLRSQLMSSMAPSSSAPATTPPPAK